MCEMVQHLQIFDYIALSGSMENRMIEYMDQLHDQFEDPVTIKHARYQVPKVSFISFEVPRLFSSHVRFPDLSKSSLGMVQSTKPMV